VREISEAEREEELSFLTRFETGTCPIRNVAFEKDMFANKYDFVCTLCREVFYELSEERIRLINSHVIVWARVSDAQDVHMEHCSLEEVGKVPVSKAKDAQRLIRFKRGQNK
jgi:hypothetical protein